MLSGIDINNASWASTVRDTMGTNASRGLYLELSPPHFMAPNLLKRKNKTEREEFIQVGDGWGCSTSTSSLSLSLSFRGCLLAFTYLCSILCSIPYTSFLVSVQRLGLYNILERDDWTQMPSSQGSSHKNFLSRIKRNMTNNPWGRPCFPQGNNTIVVRMTYFYTFHWQPTGFLQKNLFKPW